MIDIENAKKEFIKYVEQYDLTSGRIKLKVDHILRVTENSRYLAQELNLEEEQINLAELIGLFHDIGRFEQVKQYDTFSDKDTGIDHASYSLKVLYEDGLIKKFLNTNKYDYIIKKAVFNHNKANIEENLDEESLLFSKIIRDADKLDIFKVINQGKMEDIFWYKEFENLKISKNLVQEFLNNKIVYYKDVKNNADQIITFFAYVYDLNFPSCFKILKKHKYLENFLIRVEKKFQNEEIISTTKELLNIINNYIDEQIENIE